MLRENRCNRCGRCLKACAQEAVTLVDDLPSINTDRCTLCGACVKACHSEALEMIGKEMTVIQVMAEIEKDLIFYDGSGGGVTFSGGEPLTQPGFLSALLGTCKELEIHTALDTCGLAAWDILQKIGENVDLFLYDLKLMDDEKHRKFTGVSNKQILENLRLLSRHDHEIIVRIPIIPGINDDDEDVFKMGEFVASLANPPPVDLLPYHKIGVEKYIRLKRTYRLSQIQTPGDEGMKEIAQILRGFGLQVTIGGEPYDKKSRSLKGAKP
jgi:pyruvate formate lyase activating enzyme